jgi:hypothetical protein
MKDDPTDSREWKVKSLLAQADQGNLFPEDTPDLLINPDNRLGDFQEQGGYLDKEKPMRDLNPRRKGGYVPPRTRRSLRNKQRNLEEQGKQKRIEDWRKEQGLEGTNIEPNFFMQIKGNPSFDIDPNRTADDPRIKATNEKLINRAGSGQQGADIAREKLKRKGVDPTDLPQFLKINNADIQSDITRQGQLRDAQENKPFDDEMNKLREIEDQLTPREKIDWLLNNKRIKDGIISALRVQGIKKITNTILRRAAQGYLTWSLMR